MQRNWNNEKENLGTGDGIWFKPAQGQQKIKFLNEGAPEYQKTFDNGTVTKVDFEVEVSGDRYTWSVTKGKKDISLWGQIVTFATAKGGLTNQEMTLLTMGTGKDTRYTVMDNQTIPEEQVN